MKLLIYESYLKMIKNSVGTKMFRNLYLEQGNRKIDVIKNGELSCAFFVSNILLMFGLISKGHVTVESTTKDMIKSGWKKASLVKAKPGDVIIWEEKTFPNDKPHFHNGFYIGNKKAVSNNYKKGVPIIHSWNYNTKRKIIAVYTYPKLK